MASNFEPFRGKWTGIMRESVAVKHPVGHKASQADDVIKSFVRSIDTAKRSEQPYRNWSLQACFPAYTVDDILALPFEAPSLESVSGQEPHEPHREDVRHQSQRHLSPHRIRSRHRRLLARAAHRSRREGVHLVALSVEGSEPQGSRHRYL